MVLLVWIFLEAELDLSTKFTFVKTTLLTIHNRGIEILFNSLERNFGMSLALEHIDLSDNSFSDTGSIAIASWLSKAKRYNHHFFSMHIFTPN